MTVPLSDGLGWDWVGDPVDNASARSAENAKTACYRYVAGRSREARWEGFEPPAA